MKKEHFDPDALRLITERCLIAADIDKTVLAQSSSEREDFLRKVAPLLLESAALGANLAFVTGNSMHELTSRFLRWLIGQLCHTDDLLLLYRFHFFCNSGGVYARFSTHDERLRDLISKKPNNLKEKIFDELTFLDKDGKHRIRPRFIDKSYIIRSKISSKDLKSIRAILKDSVNEYLNELDSKLDRYSKDYEVEKLCKNGKPIEPYIDLRTISYGSETDPLESTVQVTLKPILSFRHARKTKDQARLIEKDLRSRLIRYIQSRLDKQGLSHYVARPGGRSSIDVTLLKLDKAYALEFLIDRLNLQGHARQGKKFGSNTIYFGDEVIVGGGNDYPVTRIPGLLVFAVNSDKQLIPFLSHVYVPSSILEGPDATAEVLTEFNRTARKMLIRHSKLNKGKNRGYRTPTALEVLKKEMFASRIREKIDRLQIHKTISAEDWQTLHAFVTLMSRDDQAARKWLSMLINELDEIMTQISDNPKATQPAIGTSHPDN